MYYVNGVLNWAGNLLFFPFVGKSPWYGMVAASCLTAAVFVWIFRGFSNQSALKRKKGRMFARALELLLFRHDMIVSLKAFPRIAAANASYLKELLLPVGVALIPSVLLLIQLASWFDHRPYDLGESVLVTVDLDERVPVLEGKVLLATSPGLEVETEALRVPSLNQLNWRLRAQNEGAAWIDIQLDEVSLRKSIIVGSGLQKTSECRVRSGFWKKLLHPSEPPIGADNPVEQICVRYPDPELSVAGLDVPWIVAFLVLTMLFGIGFGRFFKVSF